MDKKIALIEYRQNHPNCKWCIWYKYHSPSTKIPFISCSDFTTCELKEKIIYFPKIKAKICKWYKVKEEIK